MKEEERIEKGREAAGNVNHKECSELIANSKVEATIVVDEMMEQKEMND